MKTEVDRYMTMKAGWVCKDSLGLWWSDTNPSWREAQPFDCVDGLWYSQTNFTYMTSVIFNDPWPDHPNGGPECILEINL